MAKPFQLARQIVVLTLRSRNVVVFPLVDQVDHVLPQAPAEIVELLALEGIHIAVDVAFLEERWASRVDSYNSLRVFLLPGERPATRGWVTPLGSRSGACQPLP